MNKELADTFFREHSIRFIEDYIDGFKDSVLFAINSAFGFCEQVKELDATRYSRCFFAFKVKNTYIICHRHDGAGFFSERILVTTGANDSQKKGIHKATFSVDLIIKAVLESQERAEKIKEKKQKKKEIRDLASESIQKLELSQFINKLNIKANRNNTFNVDLSNLNPAELELLVERLK